MFHVIGAPAAIFIAGGSQNRPEGLDEDAGRLEAAEAVFYDGCMRCGRCVAACPSAGAGEAFAPRDFVQWARKKMWGLQFPCKDIRLWNRNSQDRVEESLWHCTTCGACLEVCPLHGAAFEAVAKERRHAIEEGALVPPLLTQTLEKLFKYDNPWESSKKHRADWTEGLEIADLAKRGEPVDLCYFVGCTTSFDDRAKGLARSFAAILQKADVRFGIFGTKEPCCGDIARRAGESGLAEEQRDKCATLFENTASSISPPLLPIASTPLQMNIRTADFGPDITRWS